MQSRSRRAFFEIEFLPFKMSILARAFKPAVLLNQIFATRILHRKFHRTSLLLGVSLKTDKPKIGGLFKKDRFPSKRKEKYYKMKTHKGAGIRSFNTLAARWNITQAGNFKRSKTKRSHLRRKVFVTSLFITLKLSSSRKRVGRIRILANSQQRNFLKKLIPYWKKKYSKK